MTFSINFQRVRPTTATSATTGGTGGQTTSCHLPTEWPTGHNTKQPVRLIYFHTNQELYFPFRPDLGRRLRRRRRLRPLVPDRRTRPRHPSLLRLRGQLQRLGLLRERVRPAQQGNVWLRGHGGR